MTFKTKKIAIFTSSLGVGGAEKFAANLTFIIQGLGYEVHVISVLDKIDYNYTGKLLNLGLINNNSNPILNKIIKYKFLRRYLKTQKFDFIIDNRSRPIFIKEFLIKNFLYNGNNIIYMAHSSLLKNYVPQSKFLARLLYKESRSIVAVSNHIKQNLESKYYFKRVEFIPNTVSNIELNQNQNIIQNLPQRYILYYGRIDNKVKNLSLLLNAYKESRLSSNKVFLVILGDGPDINLIKQIVKNMDLESMVLFFEFQANPSQFIRNAIYTVLTSRFEGFPMVLIESLSLGVPVVSVDCKSGPKEIIDNEKNGLLVENHNLIELSTAFNRLFEDKKLYRNCCNNAKQSIKKFSVNIVSEKWKVLLEKLNNKI